MLFNHLFVTSAIMTNAVCSPVLGSVRSLFLLFLFHVLFANASPTDLVHNERREVAFPNFEQGYEGRVLKGQYFNRRFPLDEGKAAEFNGGVTVASPFQDPSALKPNGWTRYIYWFPFKKNSGDAEPFLKFPSAAVRRLKLEITKEPEYGTDLDNAFADADYPVDKTKAGVYHYRHDRKFDKGKKKPTMSSYSNVLVPASGAMIFVDDFSPTARQKEWKLGTVPALDKLSDVAFFQWIDACKAQMVDPKTLKVVFISHVVNDATYHVVVRALRELGHKRMPTYSKKIVVSVDTQQGRAILGSVWGSALSWMLIQHKKELGLKKITKVAVWGLRMGFELPDKNQIVGSMNMRFIVEDA